MKRGGIKEAEEAITSAILRSLIGFWLKSWETFFYSGKRNLDGFWEVEMISFSTFLIP